MFIDGYGDLGPTAEDDPEWRILAYEVLRFNTNGLFKDCGQIFAPFELDNVAEASATPAGGTLTPNPITAADTVTVINIAPIEITRERVRRGDVEIQYFNTSYEDIEIDIIRVEWTDDSVLESASYKDGVDLGISGGSPAQASISTIMPDRSKDWLKLSFDSGDAPDGLTVTIVTSTGATLTYVFGFVAASAATHRERNPPAPGRGVRGKKGTDLFFEPWPGSDSGGADTRVNALSRNRRSMPL